MNEKEELNTAKTTPDEEIGYCEKIKPLIEEIKKIPVNDGEALFVMAVDKEYNLQAVKGVKSDITLAICHGLAYDDDVLRMVQTALFAVSIAGKPDNKQ